MIRPALKLVAPIDWKKCICQGQARGGRKLPARAAANVFWVGSRRRQTLLRRRPGVLTPGFVSERAYEEVIPQLQAAIDALRHLVDDHFGHEGLILHVRKF